MTHKKQASMIVGPQPVAVEAGAQVLREGGNAFDAAVTCALVQGVVDPQMNGLGGYALLTLQLASDRAVNPIGFDAPATAGSKVTPDMWANDIIGMNPDGWGYFLKDKINDAGYTSICTPGTVKMLDMMLSRWGTRSWAEACQPAINVAEDGFMIYDKLVRGWNEKARYPEACSLLEYIERNAEAQRIYLKNGQPYGAGEWFKNPDYGQTLRHLAEKGADDFYHGELATRMSADLAANGAFVTADDLANYALRDAPPARGTYRGYEIASATAPHGGATIVAIMNILEGWDMAALGHNSAEYIYRLGMAMKAAFVDRNQHMADAAFNAVPIDWMCSKERGAYWREVIEAGKPIEAMPTITGTPTTTHVTVVDKHGNCVSLTHSLGASSGVITPGLGFMYNNSMINFDPYAGRANSIAPSKGRTTGMTPSIVYKDGKPLLVLGAPGATRIITSCLQVMLNVIDFGMSVAEAVHAPRIDCQINHIRCQTRIPEYVMADVRKRHPIGHIPFAHGGMGLVQAIHIDPVTGALSGASDTGCDGMALAV
ncbi:MAG: gamma-glutamyltransferase [Anaerolineae bacterium]|nr:gamma-glutamyltransferase [Anaerolineae bacterium]